MGCNITMCCFRVAYKSFFGINAYLNADLVEKWDCLEYVIRGQDATRDSQLLRAFSCIERQLLLVMYELRPSIKGVAEILKLPEMDSKGLNELSESCEELIALTHIRNAERTFDGNRSVAMHRIDDEKARKVLESVIASAGVLRCALKNPKSGVTPVGGYYGYSMVAMGVDIVTAHARISNLLDITLHNPAL